MTAGENVVVGVVAKPLGLKGEAFVRPDPDVAHEFAPGETFTVEGRVLVVAAARSHSGRQVVRFEGVDTREAIEELRGSVLTVPREAVDLDEDAFWNDALLGLEVFDHNGELLGILEATADGAAHDYLVVARPDGGEVLVPAVADLVDVQSDRIVVQAIPGLFDDEAL